MRLAAFRAVRRQGRLAWLVWVEVLPRPNPVVPLPVAAVAEVPAEVLAIGAKVTVNKVRLKGVAPKALPMVTLLTVVKAMQRRVPNKLRPPMMRHQQVRARVIRGAVIRVAALHPTGLVRPPIARATRPLARRCPRRTDLQPCPRKKPPRRLMLLQGPRVISVNLLPTRFVAPISAIGP